METELLKKELLAKLANATATAYGCLGHTKAEMNERRVQQYKYELTKLGVAIPNDEKLLQVGIFNGPGSY